MNQGGFTLTELLVVIVTTGLLIVIVLPTLAFSKARPQSVYCLNNFNQLARACAMYTGDNHGLYPPNPDDGGTEAGYEWVCGDVSGWSSLAAGGSAEAGDATFITNSADSLLSPYLGHSATPFKCPTDWRVCTFNGKTGVPVARSVSANGGVGTVDLQWLEGGAHSGVPNVPVTGPWLTGSYQEYPYSRYETFGSTSDFKNCSPSEIWVYADEDPLSVNDGCLVLSAGVPEIVDFPTTRHQNAACFGFCDGHTEMHKWKSNVLNLTTEPQIRYVGLPGSLSYGDWYWLAWHATRNSKTGTVP